MEQLATGGEYLLEIKDKLNDFVREASKISAKYQNQIINDKPFSNELVDNIDVIYPFMDNFERGGCALSINENSFWGIFGCNTATNSALCCRMYSLFLLIEVLLRSTAETWLPFCSFWSISTQILVSHKVRLM